MVNSGSAFYDLKQYALCSFRNRGTEVDVPCLGWPATHLFGPLNITLTTELTVIAVADLA